MLRSSLGLSAWMLVARRDPDCDVQIRLPEVSKIQAKLSADDEQQVRCVRLGALGGREAERRSGPLRFKWCHTISGLAGESEQDKPWRDAAER